MLIQGGLGVLDSFKVDGVVDFLSMCVICRRPWRASTAELARVGASSCYFTSRCGPC